MSIDWVVPALLLLAVLACAVIRPRLEAFVAVPAAVVVIAIDSLSLDHARAEALQLGPGLARCSPCCSG